MVAEICRESRIAIPLVGKVAKRAQLFWPPATVFTCTDTLVEHSADFLAAADSGWSILLSSIAGRFRDSNFGRLGFSRVLMRFSKVLALVVIRFIGS